MRLHLEELALARAWQEALPFESLTEDQLRRIRDRGRSLHRWFQAHPWRHAAINVTAIVALLGADALVLLALPPVLVARDHSVGEQALAALIIGTLHGWLLYAVTIFSIHEGAAHRLIFPGRGAVGRLAGAFANNLCRISSADPRYYAANHTRHHARFGTEDDGEFLSFVAPRRFWLALLPFGAFFNYSDFVVHRPLRLTPSQAASMAVCLAYHWMYSGPLLRAGGLWCTLAAMAVVGSHAAFFFDRVRQFTEHNLLPLTNGDGGRSLGLGFWGLLIGGGPTGQPCHWIHHLSPALPWYQQVILHYDVKAMLTDRQRQQFLIQPAVGFPGLVWRLWRDLARFQVSRAARR